MLLQSVAKISAKINQYSHIMAVASFFLAHLASILRILSILEGTKNKAVVLFSLLFWLLVVATAVQLFFWGAIFSRLACHHPPVAQFISPQHEPPISVVICARNEAENLSKNLYHFLNQNYRLFEIIVVNDHSTDTTREVVLNFQAKFPNLRLIESTATASGKKVALQKGIMAARFDIIALSDADCQPATDQWLATMQRALQGNIQIALGYSPYVKQVGLLNRFIRFETIYTALQYASFALAGMPYMGVGRNLMYRKSLFLQERGFHKHTHIASGDDDLFINAVSNRTNTTIVFDAQAFVYSQPKSSWRDYYYQKSRHLTTATSYRPLHQLALGALAASHAGHYLLALTLLAGGHMVVFVLFIYLVRIGVVSWTYGRVLQRLQASDLIAWAPMLDAGYVLYYFVFAPILLIGNKNQWK